MKPLNEEKNPDNARPSQGRVITRIWRWVAIFLSAVLISLVVGFFGFLSIIKDYPHEGMDGFQADGIVVFTGGFARLEPAVAFLKNKSGARLLISGVNRSTGDKLLQNVLDIDEDLYQCCVDIDQDAMDTIGNALGTAHWVQAKGYDRIIIVTNDYHMPRSLTELRRAMPDVELLPYAVRNDVSKEHTTMETLNGYRVLVSEYAKYVATRIRGFTQPRNRVLGIAARLSTGW